MWLGRRSSGQVHRIGVVWKGSPGIAGIMDRGGDSVLTSGGREGVEKPLVRWGGAGRGRRGAQL